MKRLVQPRADKVVQNVGKVRRVKTFPDGLAQPRAVCLVLSTFKAADYSKVVIHVKLEKEKK